MNIVLDSSSLEEVATAYSQAPAFAFDVETIDTSPKPEGFEEMGATERKQYDHRGDPRRNRVVWLALATYGRADVIPMGHPNGDLDRIERPLLKTGMLRKAKGLPLRDADYSKDDRKAVKIFTPPPAQLTPAHVFKRLEPIFFSEKLKVGHNVSFDLQSTAKYIGYIPSAPYFCTLTAAFVLDSREKFSMGLDDCLKRELDYTMKKGVGAEIEKYSFDEVAKYAFLDVKYTWLLYRHLLKRLIEEKAERPFGLDMDVLEVTCAMEMAGANLDLEALEALRDRLDWELDNARADIYTLAGTAFNINSNAEKQSLLWGKKSEGGRGLRPKVLTDGGKKKKRDGLPLGLADWSVSAEALESFRGQDKLATALLNYADLNKLTTTYVTPYLGGEVTRTTNGKERTVTRASLLVNGKIHTRFSLISADTGRFSSKNPNLQNIPNPRTPNGKAIRNCFIAPPGHRLVVADYSQIEPRVIASFTEDPRMMGAYLNGEDIYTTISSPLGIDRAGGKVLMLSLSYGVGPDHVASSLGIPVPHAQQILDDFQAEFATVMRYKREVIRQARARRPVPYVRTLMGRRRYLPDLTSPERGYKARAERQAFNTVIQGSAADIIKIAMVRAHRMIPEKSYLSLTVHDELVTVAPDDRIDETVAAIRDAMEGIDILKVPLIADIKVVDRWGDAK